MGRLKAPALESVEINGANYFLNLMQLSNEWNDLRRGLITASNMHLLLTPTLRIAANDKSRAHIYALAAQRITKRSPESYISYDMERGLLDEGEARNAYIKNYAPVRECGLITKNFVFGVVGYSPDGLVGEDGLIEIKSRNQTKQMETLHHGEVPKENMLQLQTALLVTGRKWLDYISYSNGFCMYVTRVYPDLDVYPKIMEAAEQAEAQILEIITKYEALKADKDTRLIPVKWIDHSNEIALGDNND